MTLIDLSAVTRPGLQGVRCHEHSFALLLHIHGHGIDLVAGYIRLALLGADRWVTLHGHFLICHAALGAEADGEIKIYTLSKVPCGLDKGIATLAAMLLFDPPTVGHCFQIKWQ